MSNQSSADWHLYSKDNKEGVKIIVKWRITFKRIVALVLAFMVGAGGCFTAAFAESVPDMTVTSAEVESEEPGIEEGEFTEPEVSTEIAAVEPLKKDILTQSFVAFSGKKPVLPENVSVKMTGGDAYETVAITWEAVKKYNNKVAGIYKYEGSLPEEYSLAAGVTLPEITVKVTKCKTQIKGVAKTLTRKARKSLSDTVTVYNGYGSKLKLQMYNKKSGKWVTKSTITLKNQAKQVVKVKYTNEWWKVTTSKWRLKIEPTAGKTGWTHKATTVKTKRYYQNPSKYVQIKDSIALEGGDYNLKSGYMGLKVRQVNRYFGIGDKYWPRYTSSTKSRVRSFQSRNGLPVTGVVDKATWLKMGYSEYSWNNLGAYVSPVRVNPSSTKQDHIEAMIDRAYDYLGADYVVGGSGTPEQGADCSGFVMQCLFAAGVEIPGINPVTHSKAGHEFESRNIWNHADFKKVSYSNRKRGDLIFYGRNSSGPVNHVAIYLGNDRVIESNPNKVATNVAKYGRRAQVVGVMRVFN